MRGTSDKLLNVLSESQCLAAEEFPSAEVGKFHTALIVHQGVVRLDVGMHDPFVVGTAGRRGFTGPWPIASVNVMEMASTQT